jgi:hypothetical protein
MIQKKNNLKKRKTAIDILEAEPNQSEKNQYFDLLNLMATLFLNIFITARIEISKFCWNRLCVAKQFIRSRMVKKDELVLINHCSRD